MGYGSLFSEAFSLPSFSCWSPSCEFGSSSSIAYAILLFVFILIVFITCFFSYERLIFSLSLLSRSESSAFLPYCVISTKVTGKYWNLSNVARYRLVFLLADFLKQLRQLKHLMPRLFFTLFSITFIVSWDLPDCRTSGCFRNKVDDRKIGYCTWTRVPNVLSLSSIKYSVPIFLIFECTLETEMSSPILTSH